MTQGDVVARLYAVNGPSTTDGQFLRSYDPEVFDGRGLITTTNYRGMALRFDNAGAAFALWRTVPKCHPVRESDGKPNRPLTAYTMEIEPVELLRCGQRQSAREADDFANGRR